MKGSKCLVVKSNINARIVTRIFRHLLRIHHFNLNKWRSGLSSYDIEQDINDTMYNYRGPWYEINGISVKYLDFSRMGRNLSLMRCEPSGNFWKSLKAHTSHWYGTSVVATNEHDIVTPDKCKYACIV